MQKLVKDEKPQEEQMERDIDHIEENRREKKNPKMIWALAQLRDCLSEENIPIEKLRIDELGFALGSFILSGFYFTCIIFCFSISIFN